MKYGPDLKYSLNTVEGIQYVAPKYLERTFEKKSYDTGSIKYGPGIKVFIEHGPIGPNIFVLSI